jgi:hypothetical protein
MNRSTTILNVIVLAGACTVHANYLILQKAQPNCA